MIAPQSIAAIEKFTRQVRQAAQANSRDIRLSMADATALLAEVTNLATRLAAALQQKTDKSGERSIGMDGGKF